MHLEALAEQILRQRDDRGSSLRFTTAGEYQVRQDQLATAARATLRAALAKSREVWGAAKAKAVREREQQRQRQQAAAVEEALARHRAALTQSAEGWKNLASGWRGGAEDMTALARLVTTGWEATRAIAGNPALLAALRAQSPGEAERVEAIARQDRDQFIANARRRMPQPPAPPPTPAPEPEPEPPTPRMRR